MSLTGCCAFVAACFVFGPSPRVEAVFARSTSLAAFLPQFVRHDALRNAQRLILGLKVPAMDWLVMIGYAMLAASVRGVLSAPMAMRRGKRLFSSLFADAGLALATAKTA